MSSTSPPTRDSWLYLAAQYVASVLNSREPIRRTPTLRSVSLPSCAMHSLPTTIATRCCSSTTSATTTLTSIIFLTEPSPPYPSALSAYSERCPTIPTRSYRMPTTTSIPSARYLLPKPTLRRIPVRSPHVPSNSARPYSSRPSIR